MPVIIAIIIFAFALGAIVMMYNQLIALRQNVENRWSDIDAQLKRRSDLIPRFIEVTKKHVEHERRLFAQLTKKRGEALSARGPRARGAAETTLSKPLSDLLALAETHAALKSDESFIDLEQKLSEAEAGIDKARQAYNRAVRDFNVRAAQFPYNIVAVIFGFGLGGYFDIATSDASIPSVDF